MRSFSIKQILVIILIFFFLFGDFFSLKKKLNQFFNHITTLFSKNRKKGV